MHTALNKPVQYQLPLFNNLESGEFVDLNPFVGQPISIRFDGIINCVVTGKRINKTFGEGMSYDAWKSAPQAVESIINPELDQSHLGIGLRDLEWERERHVRPHTVYLALTSAMKVGVTRDNSIPTRWIDQGAWKVIRFAETPYRQKAGLIEVELKQHVSDKTNWRKMLTDVRGTTDFKEERERLRKLLPLPLRQFVLDEEEPLEIEYPVLSYPDKVTSMKLDKFPHIEKTLRGIRGQYLIFDDGSVINMRSHSGYRITLEG